MQTAIKTAPAAEPITLEEAKLHLKVDAEDEESLINSLIVAARQYCERYTGRQIVSATWYCYLDAFPKTEIRLPHPPLTSVTSVKYLDLDGAEQTWSSAKYDVDIASEPGRIVCAYNQSWPSARSDIQAITIEYVCGWASANAVPEGIKATIKLLVGHWFENRQGVTTGRVAKPIEMAVDALLGLYITAEPVDL